MDLEQSILSALIYNESYVRQVLPFLKTEYFSESGSKHIFDIINNHFIKYNCSPIIDAIAIEAIAIKNLTQPLAKEIESTLNKLVEQDYSVDWLIDITEKWCRDRGIYNALVSCIEIQEDTNPHKNIDAIPDILSKALSISFDNNIGIDYLESAEDRYDKYNSNEQDKIPFGLKYLDIITKEGFGKKTLNLVAAAAGTGKSIFLCHQAAQSLSVGKNVLFITLEMSSDAIAQRIDANLLDVAMDDLYANGKQQYLTKFKKLAAKTHGKLYIKEYPMSSASTTHFKALLDELKIKKQFVPDVIFIDYLNICASSTNTTNSNSYERVKQIAEQLRGLAQKNNVPVVSAIQLNRSGVGNSDPDMSNLADSYALAMTADFIMALVSNESLSELNQIMCIQIKNRYSSLDKHSKFVLGLDKGFMKLFDVEQNYSTTDNDTVEAPISINSKNRKNLSSFLTE